MKRYLLFSGYEYYPEGGWCDFKQSFDYLSDAIKAARKLDKLDWYHIVDSHEMRILTKQEEDN